MVKEKKEISGGADELMIKRRLLILYNDDHNTFEHVINTLIEICGHDPLQAEQCTLIVHYKGKCDVKSGSFSELKPIHDEMGRRDLTVEIL
jgi:ATP-dependent Clp protease adaptor protein ClpS